MLQLFTVFHLNLGYSSLEESQRADVIKACYWPLLRLAERHGAPIGIEATGYTLQEAARIDPAWLDALRRAVSAGPCEFVGSGYAQVIGPLVPASVNAANLRLGNAAYERLLGFRPRLAFVNEQAYSAGVVRHFLDAKYEAIVMEWDNPASYRPEWDPEWRYFPQLACGPDGDAIPVIWNKAVAFQHFQRFAHGEAELDEYLAYLRSHDGGTLRSFPLYGNDVEIFDYRPGRYTTEPALADDGEWNRIDALFAAIRREPRFALVRPSAILEQLQAIDGGHRVHLESAAQPTPVKKQRKYNITRWAVTGRDDLGINTACWRIARALERRPGAADREWQELCELWASDFRTHITDARWQAYRERLKAFERTLTATSISPAPANADGRASAGGKATVQTKRPGPLLTIETEDVRLVLNCRRGLAMDGLWFHALGPSRVCGTVKHGYYDDIGWGADYYSGQLVVETPGRPKITDLVTADPRVIEHAGGVSVEARLATALGDVVKRYTVAGGIVNIEYRLEWSEISVGSLRLGDITLNPDAFDQGTLFYRTHNGGAQPETFALNGTVVEHGSAVSFLVSASHAIGITEGTVELGDARRTLRIDVDKGAAALVGLMTYRAVPPKYFCRLSFSAAEVDETRRAVPLDPANPLTIRLSISAVR